MKFKVHLVPDEGLHLEGSEPPSVLDFSEPLFRFEEPIQYQLDVTWVGDDSLLVLGKISTKVRAQCVRTLQWFDIPLVVKDFQVNLSDIKGDEADLTQEMREDILLLLPTNPVSPEGSLLKAEEPANSKDMRQVWEKLDQLKLKKK